MPTRGIAELFGPEIEAGKQVLSLGYDTVDFVELNEDEETSVKRCIEEQARLIERVSSELAKQYRDHESAFLKFASVAKGHFPNVKPVTYPSEPGQIGCAGLIPQAVKYDPTPDSTDPCYTDYKNNLWEIDLTAGNKAYILGDGSNYYQASPRDNKHAMLVIMQDGLVEIGTTPRLQQQKIYSEVASKYGITAMQPLAEEPITPSLTLYQYNTLGMLPVYHDVGVMWETMPKKDGTSKLALIGMVFYEHNFMSDLKWI